MIPIGREGGGGYVVPTSNHQRASSLPGVVFLLSGPATISGSPSCPDAANSVSTSRCLHAGNFAAIESRAAHHSHRRRDSVPRQRPPVCRRQDSSAGERDGRKGGVRSRTDQPVFSTRTDGDRNSGAVRRGGGQVF